MNRHQRLAAARNSNIARLNSTAREIDSLLIKAGIPSAQKMKFLEWAFNSLWTTYSQDRMNQRIIIENEIRNLGIRFPNGTVGKNYSFSFNLPTERISNVNLDGADALGLQLTHKGDDVFELSGKPVNAGDFMLTLSFDTLEGEPRSALKLPLAFNPDPRSIWKDQRSVSHLAGHKPDWETAYIAVTDPDGLSPRKDMVAASIQGRSHAHEGRARDDHFSLLYCEESDWYVMAVADGAGSARLSSVGSKVACETITDYCKEKLSDNPDFEKAIDNFQSDRENQEKRTILTRFISDIIYRGAVKAHESINALAAADPTTKPRDYATTLMFAICKRFSFGWFIASFWVGDGAMCLYDENAGKVKLLGTPDEGEFSGQTRFLTMPEIFRDKDIVARRMRIAIEPDFTALLLMTDGVSDPMFETDKRLNDFNAWKEFFDRLRNGFPDDGIEGVDLSDNNEDAKGQLLAWLKFWSPGNHDDRTIAILY